MVPRLLAFRPANVVRHLDARSRACPVSTRDLLAAAARLGLVLPVIRAPIAAVARGALVAAKELGAVVGLALPPGAAPEPWFAGVAQAADEVAAGLPIFLAGEVVVEGEAGTQLDRAARRAWRLVDAGLTHVAVDVATVALGERARVVGEVAAAAVEHGACVEIVVPLGDGAQAGPRAAAVFDELARRGGADLASVRCAAPADADEARLQAAALARICLALRGVPVMRRGPVTRELLALLRGSPVKACEDGGVVSARALERLPQAEEGGDPDEERRAASPLERAATALAPEERDRLEARAYVDTIELLEALGAPGGAAAVSDALERRLEER